MTPEEVVTDLSENNRQALIEKNMTPSQGMIDLLNEAGMRGFRLGSNTALSMLKGALLVKAMSAEKSK